MPNAAMLVQPAVSVDELELELTSSGASRAGSAALLEQLARPDLARATSLLAHLRGASPEGAGVAELLRALPKLKTALVLAPALSPSEPNWGVQLADLAQAQALASRQRLELACGFELHDDADALASLGGRRSSLTPVLEASRALVRAGLTVRWLVRATPALLCRLEAIFSLARDEGVDAVLGASASALGPDELLLARDFVRYRLLGEERTLLSQGRLAYYEQLLSELDPGVEANPSLHWVTELSVEGDVVRRSEGATPKPRSAWLTSPTRTPDPSYARKQLVQDLSEVALEGQKALLNWAITQATGHGRPADGAGRQLPSVLLIGAYGGEHIGDIAILGGVLFRIHRRYGTTRAILVSQRADHTRHLVPMLDTPVSLTVAAYDQATVHHHLAQVDGVVFAGGPLMDLPKQLTKHLYTVSLARRMQKPFVAEGIGAGPFARKPSEWVARRLLRMAERIAVRTSDDAEKPLVSDLTPERGRDPAFDYLETRPAELTRIPEIDRPWLERLVAGEPGRLLVGVNIRPIGHLFTAGAKGKEQATRTVEIEKKFYEELADGLARFHAASPRPVTFVFFPMNAIQFGMSDLRSAYRLGKRLGPDIDYRVWEGDASLDGVVELLRRLDIVIAMRFHAAIFAISQHRPVIGIDYRPGKRDKVAALLDDCGRHDQYRRIDELSGPWLADRLQENASRLTR